MEKCRDFRNESFCNFAYVIERDVYWFYTQIYCSDYKSRTADKTLSRII